VAARLWRSILALAAAVALASGTWARRDFSLPPTSAGAVAAGVLLALPVVFVSLSFLIARAVADPIPAPSSARRLLRALLSEIAQFTWSIIAMSAAAPAGDRAVLPAERAPRPVLLLHGILCNARVWHPLRARLIAGARVRAEDFSLQRRSSQLLGFLLDRADKAA